VKILRVRLRNYRGIADRELHFERVGVTVVAGPNEIGKSSLAEAIDLVIDELDGTTKQRVKNVQPVDRDAGAEVEIDIESGPYAFTLRKRFQRKPLTELTVTQPAIENWTGREAHERMRAILDETIDPALWRALRVQQGEALEQASWLGSASLAHALDRAAGASQRGPREESLLEAAAVEQARYFTKTGRERRELMQRADAVASAEAEVRELASALARLEQDVERNAELRAEHAALQAEAERAEATLRAREREFEPVSVLRDTLASAEARRDAALAEEREALHAARQRSQLVSSHTAAEADRAHLTEELEVGEPALLAVRAEIEHADQAAKTAKAQLAQAEAQEARQQGDLDVQRTQAELAQLKDRRDRIATLQAAIAAAQQRLAALPLDAAAVEAIRQAELQVERAMARVESEGPLVQITPHTSLRASVDGRSTPLDAGEVREMRVADALTLSLPDVADLTIVAGAAAATRLKALEEARTRCRTLCMEAGVDDHAHAARALSERQGIEQRRADEQEQLAALREDTSGGDLEARIEALAARMQALASERDAARPLGLDAEVAEAALLGAREAREQAQRDVEQGWQRREILAARHRQLETQHHETAVRLELAEQGFRDLDARLVAARTLESDEVIQREREARGARARQAEAEWREAKTRLDEIGIQEAEARLEQARRDREAGARALRAAQDESIEVTARLELRGQDGLFERWENARSQAYHLVRENESAQRRAAAARRLYDTLVEEREAVREGYSAPLRARIEALGQRIFGEAFQVELDDELRIARRILDGVSLPFDQLSAGAREQLALVTRLACASLVGDDGGAPVVLDDALGHSDAERLVKLGDVLTRAATSCQVLVLTCAPERYASVAGARILTLD
jgi:chromosome segregation ATPase